MLQPQLELLRSIRVAAASSRCLSPHLKTALAFALLLAPSLAFSAPTADSVTPGSGSGSTQNFTFKYSNSTGYTSLGAVYGLINTSISAASGCIPLYVVGSNSLYLFNDAGNATTGPLIPGAAGTLSNSQCTINASSSSATGAGNTLTLVVAVTFKSAFAGPKTIYGYAADNANQNSGWQSLGTWTVTNGGGGNTPPTADSVTPNTGSGNAGTPQTFTFKYSSVNGYQSLSTMYGLINSSLSATAGCIPQYTASNNSLYLLNDAGSGVIGPVTPGAAGNLSNSQCTINTTSSSATGAGNTLTLTVSVTFKAAFAGDKTVFGYVADNGNLNSTWQTLGSWTVINPSGGAPTADSVTPANGSGSSQNFVFKYSSASGYTNLSTVYALINGSLTATTGCVPFYIAASNALYLFNDAGNGFVGPVSPGAAGNLTNSQCTINTAASSVSGAGNTLSVNLAVSFLGSFQGTKTVFGYAADNSNANSGWKSLGSFTVQGMVGGPPTADSVTPNTGSGTSQNFTFKYTSPSGFANLNTLYALINSSLSGAAGCLPYYVASSNLLYLFNDAGTGITGPVTPGTGNSLSNSQCTINAGGSSVSGTGNSLSLTLAVSFSSATFSGAKNLYGYALDNANLNSGWQTLGTYTVNGSTTLPTADSVTPNTGSGASQSFLFKYSSSMGYTNLNTVYALINSSLSGAAGCVAYYTNNALYLYNDAGTQVTGPLTLGAAGTLSNSQCTINGPTSSANGAGNTLSLTLAVSFSSSFKGAQTLYGYALDKSGQNGGWQSLGNWTTNGQALSFSGSPLSIGAGATGNLTLNLPSPAGGSGQVIQLSSSNSGVASVPATVTVSPNSSTVSVVVSGIGFGSATITASAAGFTSATATVNVTQLNINLATGTVGLGLQANALVSLSAPAASVVNIDLTSSDPTKVTVTPASVSIAAGATVPVTQPVLTGIASGSATITASSPGYTSGSGMATVSTPTINFTGSPLSIIAGATGNLTLNLRGGQAPVGGLTFNLASSDPGKGTVPATVNFPVGTATAIVQVTGVAAGSTTITASAAGYTSATALVNIGTVTIGVPVNVTMGLGQTTTFAVNLSQAAPTAVTINLSSSDTNKVTVATVSIAAGATAPVTQPQLTGVGIGSATITASAAGYTSGSGTAAVTAPVMSFSGLPLSVTIGGTGTLNLNLSGGQAPTGGLTVNLNSSDPAKASVPASVFFAAGATTMPLTITGVALGTVNITASSPSITNAVASVTIGSVVIGVPLTTPLGLGLSSTFDVTLSQAAISPVTVNLVSSDPTKVTISPSSVIIPQGSKTPATQPQVTGIGIGSSNITASSSGMTSGIGAVNVSAPTMSFSGSPLGVALGSSGTLTLNLIGGQAPPSGLTVNFVSSDTTKATVPSPLNFPAGATSIPVTVNGWALGSATITASSPGLVNAVPSVNIGNQVIGIAANSSVGLGSQATLQITLASPAPAGGVFISLSSNDSSKVTVTPASVFIAQNATTSTQPKVTGAGIGSATITASATGFISGSGTVTVPSPTMFFSGTPLTIAAGVTGNPLLNLNNGQAPAGGLTINLVSSDPSKATVPATVTFAPSATNVSVPVTGISSGSVTITASAPGIANATATVNVTQPAIGVAGGTVGLGQQGILGITLSEPAASAVTVNLSSSDTTKVAVTPSVVIPQGATVPSTPAQVSGAGVGSATITASASGYTNGTGLVTVTPLNMVFAGSPLTLTASTMGNLSVNLTSGQAPAGGLTISLISSDSTKVTVPATVSIAAGGNTVTVPVTAIAAGSVTITATALGATTAMATVNVTQPTILVSGASLGLGQQTIIQVSLSSAAPAPLTVNLVSGDTSKVTVTTSVVIPQGATVPLTQPHVTGAGIGSANITASASGFVSGSGMVTVAAPLMSFSGSPLTVNISKTGALTLNLANGQAPASGLFVNLTSNNPGVASVPASVTFAGNTSTAMVNVTGVAAGSATITASAAGITDATATVNVPQPSINVTNRTLILGQQGNLQVTLSAPAPSAVTIGLVSSDPAKVTVSSSVVIAQGATAPATPPQVTGAGVGAVTITATANGYTAGSGTVTVPAPSLSFTGSPLTVQVGGQGILTLNLLGGQAPAGGLTVTLGSSNSGAATVPATINLSAGATTANVLVSGVAQGSATITASAPNFSPATANVIVDPVVKDVSITVPSAIIGQNLQKSISVLLSPGVPSNGLQLTVSSSDPSKLLVSNRPTFAGNQQVNVAVPGGLDNVGGIYLQALASSGTVMITATAPGYPSGTALVTLTPSGFVIAAPGGASSFTTSVSGPNTVLTLNSVRLDSSFNVVEVQPVRGVAPSGSPVSVTLNNSTPVVGTVTSPVIFDSAADTVVASFTPTTNNNNTGSTTLSIVTPQNFSTPMSGTSITATVSQSGVSCIPVNVGQKLEVAASCTLLGGNPSAGLPVTFTSNDPTKLLLAASPTDAGSSSITITTVALLGGNIALPGFYVYGVGNSGSATYSITANGFVTGTGLATLSPSGFILAGPNGIGATTLKPSNASTPINVVAARLDSDLNYVETQALAGGVSVNVNVTSSVPAVGTISLSPVTISGGASAATTQFIRGGTSGDTDLTVSTPAGFTTPSDKYTKLKATILPFSFAFSCDTQTIGQNLQIPCTVLIGQVAPAGGQPVTLTSNSAQLLLSATATGAGASAITVSIPAGTLGVQFYAQALGNSGLVTMTASSSLYIPRDASITLAPSGLVIAGPFGLGTNFFPANVSGGPVPIDVYTGFLNAANNSFIDLQSLRGGIASLPITLTSSNPGVGSISSVNMTGGSGHVVAQFTPLNTGAAAVTVLPPNGFVGSTTLVTLAAQVSP